MNKLEILLDLFYFKLIAAVSDGSIVALLFLVSIGADRIVEEVIPVEVLIVLLRILLEVNRFFL